ncbi:MAG TPA: peptidoglycan editing factor PgeF [Nevskiaceae bacterium]|nr:peptidoglycan editing factor PgeF [Nevskiaceae bacterium]
MDVALIHPDWPAPRNVFAASTTRTGGVSIAPFDTLNLGKSSGDDPAAVDENRRRVFDTLKLPSQPSWIMQVHGPRVVRAPFSRAAGEPDPQADASFTTQKGVVCLVQSADCLPVLFCDHDGTMVAAAHAGWRGLAAGVLEQTVRALPAPPRKLMAWMGPAISARHFEVGPEVRAAFESSSPEALPAFTPGTKPGKWMCDLYAAARVRLHRAGLEVVHGGDFCTFSDASRFFSFRRDGNCGRMASLIWLG